MFGFRLTRLIRMNNSVCQYRVLVASRIMNFCERLRFIVGLKSLS